MMTLYLTAYLVCWAFVAVLVWAIVHGGGRKGKADNAPADEVQDDFTLSARRWSHLRSEVK